MGRGNEATDGERLPPRLSIEAVWVSMRPAVCWATLHTRTSLAPRSVGTRVKPHLGRIPSSNANCEGSCYLSQFGPQ